MPRKLMIRVKQPLPGEDYFFVYNDKYFLALFYPLKEIDHKQIWAVSGEVKPFAANNDDFDSYDEALRFIIAHRWFH